jgi:hypothetical protein
LTSLREKQSVPFERILNADGTLNRETSFTGSFDVKGWEMRLSNKGEPHFNRSLGPDSLPRTAPNAESNGVYWDDRFSFRGVSGEVFAVAVIGTDVYVAGQFTVAGDLNMDTLRRGQGHIAKWDGTRWSTLGGGFIPGGGGGVFALAVIGTDLYAGGFIDSYGHVAKWNGSKWSSLGSGLNHTVYALAVIGTDLYAGGTFTKTNTGNVNVNYIAKWNGNQWSALSDGMSNDMGGRAYVWALASIGTDLYAGGVFTVAGGVKAMGIARWNGTQWSSLGTGLSAAALSLAVMGNDLYVGGGFVQAGGENVYGIAKWNGTQWSALGIGVNYDVTSIAVAKNKVYVGGWFFDAGGIYASRVAVWDGIQWSALSNGIGGWIGNLESPHVNALAVGGDDLYVGGWFTRAGEGGARCIAKWNGSEWSALGKGNGMSDQVRTLAVVGSDVYAGGDFTSAGGASANYIAKWNGNQWSALGDGLNDAVYSIATMGSDLFVSGRVTKVGTVDANIARWNGSQWLAVPGFRFNVDALAVIGTDLYAGGYLLISKWNGTQWTEIGNIPFGGSISALAGIGKDLYVGGAFKEIGGDSANNIAKWDGTRWSPLGKGLKSENPQFGVVRYLAVLGTDLYAYGGFSIAGDVAVDGFAKWNGSQWSKVQSPTGGGMLAVSGSNLYVSNYYGIHTWDGANWSTLYSAQPPGGINYHYISGNMAIVGTDMYIGGNFVASTQKGLAFFTRCTLLPTIVAQENTSPRGLCLEQNYPNPFNPNTTIRYDLPKAAFVSLRIFNALGQEVAKLVSGHKDAGYYQVQWSPSVPSGIYFYRLQAGEFTATKKMILLH